MDEILRNEFEKDRVYYRIKFGFGEIKKNSVICVFDSLSGGVYSWDCYPIVGGCGSRFNIPNFKQAIHMGFNVSSILF